MSQLENSKNWLRLVREGVHYVSYAVTENRCHPYQRDQLLLTYIALQNLQPFLQTDQLIVRSCVRRLVFCVRDSQFLNSVGEFFNEGYTRPA